MTFIEANQGRGNINFRKEYGYSYNCQCCVVVHEARLRGLNLTSLPYSNDPESMSFQITEDSCLPWFNKKGNKPSVTLIEGTNKEDLYVKLDKNTKSPGRYHIGINEEEGGHIITAERFLCREIIYYDAQTAEFINIKEYVKIKSFEVL